MVLWENINFNTRMNPYLFAGLYIVLLFILAIAIRRLLSPAAQTWYAFLAGLILPLLYLCLTFVVPLPESGACGNAGLGAMMLTFFVLTPCVVVAQLLINKYIFHIHIF
jgi:hypothetical protein